jgi:hypothetical protein
LTNIARKNIFGNNTGRISLAENGIRDIRTKTDIIAGVDITITT